MQKYLLKIENMTKTFPGVKALDSVHLYIKPGNVHALIGENGAGKSTLMKCLFGLYKPDSGTIEIDGNPIEVTNTQTALKNGISMIQQELSPIPHRNVVDNIWAGRFNTRGIVVDETEMRKKTTDLFKSLEFNISPNMLAKDLSVSQLQAVEIAKAVSYDSKIIIMDEPTSSLTVAETKNLFRIINKLKNEGRSIIYISHKLEEVFEIADEITVMRDGTYIGTWDVKEITVDFIIRQMVGRAMSERFPERERPVSDEIVLKVENLTSANPKSFKNVSFVLHRGEILGIGGLVGAQRTELVESLFGIYPLKAGKIFKNGKLIKNRTPCEAIENGFGMLTEDRHATGIIPMLSVKDNILVASYKKLINNAFGIISKKKVVPPVQKVCKSLNVHAANLNAKIKNLSGGNQQKVLVGRWMLTESDILILDEPTRGIDVGAKYEIYKIMREYTEKGYSIIMVSSEMPELLGMSDRILVMCNGYLTGTLDHGEATQVEVMRLATNSPQKSYNSLEAER